MANFCPMTSVYAFSATNSAGTALQINVASSGDVIPNSYLIQNLGSNAAYIRVAGTRTDAAQTIPGGSPGNSVYLPASSSLILAGPPGAFFNGQTGTSTTTLSIVGGLSTN